MNNEIYLAFDYGTKKIGVAVGNNLNYQARELCIVATKNTDELINLINQWKPTKMIVGVPMKEDNKSIDKQLKEKISSFKKSLNKMSNNIPIIEVNERLTSRVIYFEQDYENLYSDKLKNKNFKKNKKTIDAISAQLILQQWLNSEKS